VPLYEYRCKQCGSLKEVWHGFKEPHGDPCPHCGGELARVFNPTGIVFKGSGFYVTDSRKSSGSEAKSESGDGAKSGESGDGAKSAEPARAGGPTSQGNSGDAKSSDAKSSDAKSSDAKSGDAKSGDAKSSDAKSSDAKSGDAKSSDGRSAETSGRSEQKGSGKSDTAA
jgi:putative FmdB family regulatory protein